MNSAASRGRIGPHRAYQAAGRERRGERPEGVVMGATAS
jgi:hypothetical protein